MTNKIKFFIDTEFIELGRNYPLELLSIGIVCENGNTLYLENLEANYKNANDWVKQNVFLFMNIFTTKCFTNKYCELSINEEEANNLWKLGINTLAQISFRVEGFIKTNSGENKPEFWGYFCDYDWVVFCQLFGTMMDLPKGFPHYCNDLKQLMKSYGIDESLDELTKQESNHNALDDAKQIKLGYEIVMDKEKLTHHFEVEGEVYPKVIK